MSQKRKRQGKAPPKDFLQEKGRVGQKKRLAENQTRAEVKVKPVKVGEQTNITRYEAKGVCLTSRNLTLEEVLAQTNHHNANTRRDAYLAVRELLDRYPTAFISQLGYILVTLAKSLTDLDELVRKHHRAVVERILQLLIQSETKDGDGKKSSKSLAPFTEQLGFQLRSAMTHRDISVRADALTFVELLMDHNSMDDYLMNRIVVACVKGSVSSYQSNTIEDSFEISTVFINDLYNKCLAHRFNLRHLSQLFRVGRIAIRVLKLSSLKDSRDEEAVVAISSQQSLSFLVSSWTNCNSTNRSLVSTSVESNGSDVILSNELSNGHHVVVFLNTLIDCWAHICSLLAQPKLNHTAAQQKVNHYNETVLRKILNDIDSSQGSGFNSTHGCRTSTQRTSFSTADEHILISAATRLDILKLIHCCLQYLCHCASRNDGNINLVVPLVSTVKSTTKQSQPQIGLNLLHEVLLPGFNPFSCPTGVNRKVFHSIDRQLSLTLIQTTSVILSSSFGTSMGTLSPLTSAILISLFSHGILMLPDLLDLKHFSQNHFHSFFSTLSSTIAAVRLATVNNSTLLSCSIKTLATVSGFPVRCSTKSNETVETEQETSTKLSFLLQDTAIARSQSILSLALRKLGISGDNDFCKTNDKRNDTANGQKVRGFALLARKGKSIDVMHSTRKIEEESDTKSGCHVEETDNILIQLKRSNGNSASDIINCLQGQMVSVFDRLWQILESNETAEAKESYDVKTRNDHGKNDELDDVKNLPPVNEKSQEKVSTPINYNSKLPKEHGEEENNNKDSAPTTLKNSEAAWGLRAPTDYSSPSDQHSTDEEPETPRYINHKRRKLSAGGDYELRLSKSSTSSNDTSQHASPSSPPLKQPLSANTTLLDFRVCLVPFFSVLLGIPVEYSSDTDSKLKIPRSNLHWALSKISPCLYPQKMTISQVLDFSILSKCWHWGTYWIDLAASLCQTDDRVLGFVLTQLLAFAQHLTRVLVTLKDIQQKDLVVEISRSLLQRLITKFVSDPSALVLHTLKSIQRQLILVTAELSLSHSSLHEFILNSPWLSVLFSFRSADFVLPKEVISLYIDLVLTCHLIPIADRIRFIKFVISESRSSYDIIKICRAHSDRLRSEVETASSTTFLSVSQSFVAPINSTDPVLFKCASV